MQTSSILTVGSIAFDSVETPSGKVDKVLGGAANYFSIAASFFAPVRVVGVVGRDFPDSHLDYLKSRKIDTRGIQKESGDTFHWVGSYEGNLAEAKTHATLLNVFEHFNPTLPREYLDSDYLFLANIHPTLQSQVLDQIPSTKLVACDTMNFWIQGTPEELKKTLKRVHLLCINETEALLLTGKKTLRTAVQEIQTMGPTTVIIKKGEHGAMLFYKESVFFAPAFLLDKVVDPTGAGDSFAGAMFGFLAEQKITQNELNEGSESTREKLKKAMIAGCAMASFTVEDFSFRRLEKLTSAELISRQNSILKMLQI